MAILFNIKDRQQPVKNEELDDDRYMVSLDDLADKLVECQAKLARTKDELDEARIEFMRALEAKGVIVFDED